MQADVLLRRIERIPPGFVATYGDICPGAPRFTGTVLSRYPGADEVPWWRVVRADGVVVKGERQAALLRDEGVPFRGSKVDLDECRVWPGMLD